MCKTLWNAMRCFWLQTNYKGILKCFWKHMKRWAREVFCTCPWHSLMHCIIHSQAGHWVHPIRVQWFESSEWERFAASIHETHTERALFRAQFTLLTHFQCNHGRTIIFLMDHWEAEEIKKSPTVPCVPLSVTAGCRHMSSASKAK